MIFRLAGLLALCGLMLATMTAQYRDVFVDGRVYFVDADCYARMSRVDQVLQHPLQPVRHHDFENFPQGIATHTTAPLDWLIALLTLCLRPFTAQSLDLAGAWISPLLGLATLGALWAWSTRLRLPFRHAMLLVFAISPIVMQAFRLGRPDHQSLLLFLMVVGLAAEWSLWKRPRRSVAIAWGAAWGLALWTSLYEPLIVFALLLGLRLALLRRDALSREWRVGGAVTLGVFGCGLLFDGWHGLPSAETTRYFANWSRSIAELAHLPPLSPQFFGWLGWLAPALPFLLVWRFAKTREPHLLALLVLVLATYGLTCWQIRWGCYLALAAVMALPFALAAIPSRVAAWTALVVSLAPFLSQWDQLLYPAESQLQSRDLQRAEYVSLRQVGEALVSDDRTGILSPWWLAPPLAYWSGQPCVAGSSHESLPGIVDAARFYLTPHAAEARAILEQRKVSYVVVCDPALALDNLALLFDQPAPADAFGASLYKRPSSAPSWLALAYSNAFFKVYAVLPPSTTSRPAYP